ncbi:acyl-coenzyme A thioesterase 2, chloroplastic [Magnolia sinica]|uniref:acyl-coenzyme A thioesterase 2, chloroplastic n=1 Tax=Magnolia sinica TaxID=86752 RepID=UPI0026595080|nr:acyl-coenzyme A thioesterase 2, chloroplastic [Magnolia sinica]
MKPPVKPLTSIISTAFSAPKPPIPHPKTTNIPPVKPVKNFLSPTQILPKLLNTTQISTPPLHKQAHQLYFSQALQKPHLFCTDKTTQTRSLCSSAFKSPSEILNSTQISTPPSLPPHKQAHQIHYLSSSKTLPKPSFPCTKTTQTVPFCSSIKDPTAIPPESMDPTSSPSGTIPVVSTFSSPFENSPPSSIDASSSIRKPLSLWPGMYHSPVTNALWEARSSIFEKLLDPSKDGPPQSELLTKTPSQSRISILYNFSSDYILREQYRDPWNEVRIGKLLEDLDALAGTISVKHCSNDDSTTRPLLLVTASVDKMVLKKPIRVDTDLKIAGAVIWVGRSSIEIRMEVTQAPPQESSDPSDPIALTANFTFVARDSKTLKSAPVNRLSPENEREKWLLEEGEARDRLRKRKREEQKREFEKGGHVLHGEVSRLKALLAEGRVFCDMPALADRDSILMRDTRLENSLICQPQQRNLHGRIFGGFLMHRAFELAFSTAYAFVGHMPCFLEVDHVDFLRPVDVGDFLRFKSCVLYTQLENPMQPLINIEVVAHVTRPELRISEVSNTFYFTFTVQPDALKNGLKIRNVVPATEEEARRVLERIDAEESYL